MTHSKPVPVPPRAARRAAPVSIADLRGAVRLAVEGVHGVTRIAQGLHGNIARLAPPVGRQRERPAGGLSGMVYGSVRAGSSLVGAALDTLLAAAQAWTATGAEGTAAAESPARSAIVAALNGVMGDHLARTGNPLAIPMELVVRGAPSPRLLLLVHGLCMDDRQWLRQGHDHGMALADALGCTPVYVRYNSGRHVSANGADLAQRLDALLAQWPLPAESIAIVGHSMGGLVARSAVQQARDAGMAWPRRLRKMVFLGTPHHGAALERGGNWLHAGLGASPYLAPFTRLGALRSDGITDLRHGNVLEGDWSHGRYHHRDMRTPTPLPRGVACYAVAASLGEGPTGQLLGDGLVSVDSALGRHAHPTRDLHFPLARTWVSHGSHHLDLLDDRAVFGKLLAWLR